LRKATIRFVMSARPSVCPHGTTRRSLTVFHEISYLSIFRKYVQKVQVSIKSDMHNGYFTWGPIHIFDQISLRAS